MIALEPALGGALWRRPGTIGCAFSTRLSSGLLALSSQSEFAPGFKRAKLDVP